MANKVDKNNGRYVPTRATCAQMQIWIDNQRWFEQRKGRQRDFLLAIAKDCGYTTLPKKPASIKALIGEHIATYFSKSLAWKFNKMVDEL